jgi:FlaA1/EpsC-like NDP-sugar epimerase
LRFEQADIARIRQRIGRTTAELSYDIVVWIWGMLVAAWVTRDLSNTVAMQSFSLRVAVAVCVLSPASGLLAGLYQSKYQRGSLAEVVGVGTAAVGTCFALAALTMFLIPGQQAPLATVAGAAVFAVLAMLGARYVLFAVRQRIRTPSTSKATAVRVIVFGAGAAGSQLVHSLLTQPDAEYRPVAILDDDPAKRRLRILGVPVLGDRSAMAHAAAKTGAAVLVIAIARASGTAIRDLTAQAERCGLVPKVIPSITELLSGVARIEGVRDPRISDLLGRRPVQTDVASVAGHFAGKRILVTGAGGSIGSELCRQLHHFGPAELIMLDRDESALHAVQLALHGRALLDQDGSVLADIRDPRRIRQVFEQFRPQIVFHAAALKHLPLLERYPAEALKTNVWGTCTVLEAAAACDVESFVNISTDKAADPVSVLGYSKRAAERLTAHMAGEAAGTYLSVRFGNVLGSRGSVLTALSAQIAAGGPVTVTHPEVSRYFMTADEAVQLVLQAAAIGRDGEVLVLDMGEQIRIADMARRLVATVPRPVDIVYTGLRPGEKLAEDLLGAGEQDERPYHPLIRHVPVTPLTPDAVIGLDPGDGLAGLRAALASCVTGANGASAATGSTDASGPADDTEPAGRTGPGIATGPTDADRPNAVRLIPPPARPGPDAELTLGSR